MRKVGMTVVGFLEGVLVVYWERGFVLESVGLPHTHIRCNLKLLGRTQ